MTETGEIQYRVEKGNTRVHDLGNDYEDNRLFRLTCRLLSVYGWDSTIDWFREYWDISDGEIKRQVGKISENYDDLPGPSK